MVPSGESVLPSSADGRDRDLVVWRRGDLGVAGLLWQLRDDPRLLAFVDDQLAPVLRLASPQRERMLASLRAFADADGVVAAFATRLGVSRAAAYRRADRLSELLGRDLTAPSTRVSVQVALVALGQTYPTS